MQTCCYCVNDTRNPIIKIDKGLCQTCLWFNNHFSNTKRLEEIEWFNNISDKTALLGMSGGKDSTAAAIMLQSMNWNVHGFTFDSGYYPKHINLLAQFYANKLNIPHEVIDIRSYINKELRECFEQTAQLFDAPLEYQSAIELYQLNRQHYGVKDKTIMPFLRGCQLCRKMVIPAYYGEAVKRNIKYVILGMNEWTHLADGSHVSAIRRLKPAPEMPEVFVIHLPFLFQVSLTKVQELLSSIKWVPPRHEDLIETNGNSCCLARATQKPFQDILGFHPDTTRLSREITCGFLDRETVKTKLRNAREFTKTVRQVLQEADIIQ